MKPIVHTGLYSHDAQAILEMLIKFSRQKATRRPAVNSFRARCVEMPDGEICIESDNDYYANDIWTNHTTADIKTWLAIYFKKFTIDCIGPYAWEHERTQRLCDLLKGNTDIACAHECVCTVCEIQFICDKLLERRAKLQHYDLGLIKRIVGVKRSDAEAKNESARREAVDAVNAKYERLRNEATAMYRQRVRDSERAFKEEYARKKRALYAEYAAKFKELDLEAQAYIGPAPL